MCGYKTLFAYFKERERGTVTEANLAAAMGLHVKCGNFSYAEIPRYYDQILGVNGTLESLGDFDFQWVRQGKYYAVVKLGAYGGGDVGVVVAEGDGGEAADEVDVFVAIDVPNPATLSFGNEVGGDAKRVLGLALAEGLRAERYRS